jgi:hypothetical protein
MIATPTPSITALLTVSPYCFGQRHTVLLCVFANRDDARYMQPELTWKLAGLPLSV